MNVQPRLTDDQSQQKEHKLTPLLAEVGLSPTMVALATTRLLERPKLRVRFIEQAVLTIANRFRPPGEISTR